MREDRDREPNRDTEIAELLKEVRRIAVQSRRLVINLISGGYSSVFRGAGIEFDEVREYAEGDDPRRVDWNVTARMGRPFVKKYVDERELTVLFVLDCSPSMSCGFGEWSGRQAAARVCACLALSANTNNDKVGLIAFSRKVDKYVPPKKGLGHVLRIVRDCLALPGSEGGGGLEPALEFASRVLRRRAVLFLLSDFLPGSAEAGQGAGRPAGGPQDNGAPRGDALALCARRHDLVAVRFLPPELEPPAAGLVRLSDPETGRRRIVDWSRPSVRAAYTARAAAWRARTVESLRRAGVDLMDVPMPRAPDPDAIARPLLRFFRMRELRGAKR